MLSGLAASLLFILLGPYIMNPTDGWIRGEAIISLYNPGIITIPIGFLGAYLGSLFSRKQSQSTVDFNKFYLQSQSSIAQGEKRNEA